MLTTDYTKYIYKVNGESVVNQPDNIFEENGVYLIIDKELSLIWIWAGSKSRLFHRYIASTWAGKLRSRKKYYNYKYEVVKQGREPESFLSIYNEINQGRIDLNYPGESRKYKIEAKKSQIDPNQESLSNSLSQSEKTQINGLLAEITEMIQHISYSMEHIGKRIKKINDIMNT
ncbi:MAG: hypothetical protein GF383_12485 [Candidatus Lokiarchaeota archaeon]|nr:hypothetical protein [Candidatus Lokiarchaeota archaeon]MBD3341827.1 hypothetical protein [Candidatus Lokiarchaeota archaeon]